MRELWRDFGYALRQLRRSPGFALTAVLTLSLTVGLAATVFSVFDALLVRPLPYGEPERIVVPVPRSAAGYTQPAATPEYEFWRENNRSFSALAGFSTQTMNLRGPNGPVPIHALHATDNFFDALGVKALLGRTFLPSENAHGDPKVAVLSYALWQKAFGGRQDVLASKIELDGRPMTIVGIMPQGFRYPLNQNEVAFAPFTSEQTDHGAGYHWMRTLGRLKPGVTTAQAEADMTRVLAAYARISPDSKGRRMELLSLADALLGETGGLVEVLVLAVVAVLALGCVNIAGLMLVRGLRRERELALRAALGGSRQQLARQLLAEIVLLALAGTAGGGLVAWALLLAIRALLQASLQRGAEVALNPSVLAASLFAALLTLLVAGFLPLRQLFAIAPGQALRSGSAGSGASRSQRRLGSAFIGTQLALAMVLLATSGLLLRMLASLHHTDLGFRTNHLLVEDVNLSPGSIKNRDIRATFYEPLLAQVRAIPGVSSAAIINMLPIANVGSNDEIQIVGHPPGPPNQQRLAEYRYNSPGYDQTLGTRLLRGRLTGAQDTLTSQPVVVVNQAFVRKFFAPGEDPIGAHIASEDNKPEIIGVVSDQRQDLFASPLAETDYPVSQIPAARSNDWLQEMQLVLRTTVPPLTLAEPLRKAIQQLDPTLPFRPVETMDDVVGEALVLQRMESWLFGTFAALAVLLAAIGLYGLIAQQVEWGRRDIGVRMALGSTRAAVVGLVLKGVARVSLAGLGAGLLLAWMLRRVIGSVLPTRTAHEIPFVLALAAGMELLALLACAAPARRAASVDPVEVLRAE